MADFLFAKKAETGYDISRFNLEIGTNFLRITCLKNFLLSKIFHWPS